MTYECFCAKCQKKASYPESSKVDICTQWFSSNYCMDCTMVDDVAGAPSVKCVVCGCTEDRACVDDQGETCFWILSDLCSSCYHPPEVEL